MEDNDEEIENEHGNEEFAIDRAAKIGFFVDEFEFCMRAKDIRTVQRRFKLFYSNWKDFQ